MCMEQQSCSLWQSTLKVGLLIVPYALKLIFPFLFFSAKNYWAKDLIFLVTSHEGVGMQAWVDQYMGLQGSGEKKKEWTWLVKKRGRIARVWNKR